MRTDTKRGYLEALESMLDWKLCKLEERHEHHIAHEAAALEWAIELAKREITR